MNLRWLWLDHFPAGLDITAPQRKEAKRRARAHRKREKNFRGSLGVATQFIGFMTTVLSLAFMAWMFMLVTLKLRTAGFVTALVTGTLLFQALLWITITYALHRTSVPYVRKALCDMNLPVCLECGYILAGLRDDESRCPECGTTREQDSQSIDRART